MRCLLAVASPCAVSSAEWSAEFSFAVLRTGGGTWKDDIQAFGLPDPRSAAGIAAAAHAAEAAAAVAALADLPQTARSRPRPSPFMLHSDRRALSADRTI